MKKLNLLFTLAILFGAFTFGVAQDAFYIKQEITDVKTSDEGAAMMVDMIKGSETEVFSMDGKSLAKMNMMGGMLTMKIATDPKSDITNMYMDMMGQKIHVETTKEEMLKAAGGEEAVAKNTTVTYDKTDTKEILGYKCYKANVSGDNGMKIEMYVSEEVKADPKTLQSFQNIDMVGFPLEYSIDAGVMQMMITTKVVNNEVDASVFNIDTANYQKMTFEELTKMGGGMGF